MYLESVQFLKMQLPATPRVAVILGSGLGGFADELTGSVEIPYADIPDWPQSTVVGHAGKLTFGRVGEVPLLALSGRSHFYEGHPASRVTYAVRVLHLLGIRSLILTNAAGGINPALERGGLVLITDHINLQGVNPLVGANDESFGPRFPDMSEVYYRPYRDIALAAASDLGIQLSEGIYAALLGPSYETPAEIRYLRAIGADVVGMSTVPEAIAANHQGTKVLALSCVTNMAAGVIPNTKINHSEVLETGAAVRGTLIQLIKAVLPRIWTHSD